MAAWQGALPEPHAAVEHELANMVLIGRLMATAALERCESRGAHYRSDCPDSEPQWRRHIVVSCASAARGAKENT